MLIPYATDAPIYYWPYATVGTIVVNALVFLSLFGLNEELASEIAGWLILRYGWWNPVQWVTSNYVHGDIMHLLGNMFVLWGVGIVVEGKLGWWRFLLLYNGIGIAQCGVEQTLMLLASEGGSFGASAIIYGLIVIAALWAPRNDLTCFYLFFYMWGTFEISILNFAWLCVGLEVVIGLISVAFMSSEEGGIGLAITSQVLHLMGAAAGAVIGSLMLRLKWVDCENWDLFSIMQDRHMLTREQLAEEALNSPEAKARLVELRDAMIAQVRSYLAHNEAAGALAVHRRGRLKFQHDWPATEEDLVALISGLRKIQKWDEAAEIMTDYLQRHTQRAAIVRLALGQVLVERLGRPKQALKALAKLDSAQLSAAQQSTYRKLVARAQLLAEENPFEAIVDDV